MAQLAMSFWAKGWLLAMLYRCPQSVSSKWVAS